MRLKPEDIAYRQLPSQIEAIREGLDFAKGAKPRLSWDSLRNIINDWWEEHAPDGEVVSEELLKKSTLYDMAKSDSTPDWEKARAVLAFLTFGPHEFRCNGRYGFEGILRTEAHHHAHAILQSFGRRFSHNNSHLAALQGSYEAYRPSWRKGRHDYVIRSHVEFERDGPAMWMTERQNFICPNTGQPVYETDRGVVFFFSSAIACLAQSQETDCMKLYSFTERQPEPSIDPRQSAAMFSPTTIAGHIMAISMQGPHPSSPIYMIRKTGAPRRSLAHLHVSELDGDPSREIQGAVSWLRASQVPLGRLPSAPESRV